MNYCLCFGRQKGEQCKCTCSGCRERSGCTVQVPSGICIDCSA